MLNHTDESDNCIRRTITNHTHEQLLIAQMNDY